MFRNKRSGVRDQKIKTIFIFLILFFIIPAVFAALDVAVIDIESDVDEIRYARTMEEFERITPIRFYQAESVRFDVTALHGKTPVALTNENIFVRWEAYTSPGSTNAYIHKAGSVVSSTGGQSRIELTPSEANLPPGVYYSFVRAFQPLNGTNRYIGVLAYNRLEVIWSPDANNYDYLGPFPVLQGVQGIPGTNGLNGMSAYQVAVSNGFVGTQSEWLASLVGPTGSNDAARIARLENGGFVTNLTVVNSFSVTPGEAINTDSMIYTDDYPDFFGLYTYAGDDEYYGAFFTNQTGKVIYKDVYDMYGPDFFLIGSSLGNIMFYGISGIWYLDADGSQTDIGVDPLPSHTIIPASTTLSDEFSIRSSSGYALASIGGSNFNQSIGKEAGKNFTFTGNPNDINHQSLFIGSAAGRSSSGYSILAVGSMAGDNAFAASSASFIGDGAGFESASVYASTFVGSTAGKNSGNISDGLFIGRGTGANAQNCSKVTLIGYSINNSVSDYSDALAIEANGVGVPVQYSAIWQLGKNLSIGRTNGTLNVRGTNVISGTIVTNFVQQKNGSGYVTNIVLQGITGKIIK